MLKKHFDAAAADGVEGRLSMELFIVVMSQLLNLPDEVPSRIDVFLHLFECSKMKFNILNDALPTFINEYYII